MTKPSPVDVCCEVAKQFDIPQVEAIRMQIDAVGTVIWEEMLTHVSEEVAQAQRDEQGPGWILLLLFLTDQALLAAPSVHSKDLLRASAVRLGAGDRATTAVEDYLLLLRGRFQQKREEITDILSRREGSASALRRQLADLFGPVHTWITPLSDLWSYRWNWIGDILTFRKRGVTLFTYTNPDDERTTPFCRWLIRSGRTVSVGKVLDQVNNLESAIVENDIERAIKAWPLLSFTGKETASDFNDLFVSNNLGSPPFHWRCRTRLTPV